MDDLTIDEESLSFLPCPFLQIAKLCTQSSAFSIKRRWDHCISAYNLPPFPFAVLHKKEGLELVTAMVTAWVHLLSHLKVLYPKWNWLLPAVFVAVYSGAQLKQPKLCTIT